jgi:hypothetical protein
MTGTLTVQVRGCSLRALDSSFAADVDVKELLGDDMRTVQCTVEGVNANRQSRCECRS